jgi:hypothetical protein
MADYFQVKNQNIFNPPANTSLGNATNQFNDVYVENDLVLGNVTVTGATIIAPRVTTIAYPGDDTAADTAGGQTITITGTGFVAGASVLINGSAVGVVSVVSSTTITIVSPANTTGSYVIYVVNPDGSTAIAIPGIQYSGTPTWTTAAGTLGNVYETASFTQTVTATGDAPITYSVASGAIPPGSTFNANGTITGTSQLSSSPTTYSFTVRATDAQLQDTDRAFSIAVIPDVVTWSSPTDNATYSPAANIAIANITLSATSAVGSGITYTANTLPTGLSLTGANISGTPTVVANTSSLLTATANTTSELSSITINWVVSVASDPYFMYNSLLLPGNGSNGAQNNTFLDGSTNNFTITRYGNTTQGTFSPYGPNWSNYFDGNGDWLELPTNSMILGSSNFTFEAWIFPIETSHMCVINGQTNMATVAGSSFSFNINGDSAYLYSGSSTTFAITAPTVTRNVWSHIAYVRTGATFSIYLNGTRTSTTSTLGSSSINTGTYGYNAKIGINGGATAGNNDPFSGYISNLRGIIGSGGYDATQTTITVPTTTLSTTANTALLTCQSNRFIDNSTNAFAITASGNTKVQRFSPFSPTAAYSAGTIGGSGYFDGTGDYLSIPSNAVFQFGTGDFTIECWFYDTGTSDTYPGLISSANGWQTGSTALRFNNLANRRFGFYHNPTGDPVFSSTNTFASYQWCHVAVARSGTSLKMFVNGVQEASATVSASISLDTTTGVLIGSGFDGSSNIKGYVSNVRVVKGTAVYTSAFTPPTAPVTAIANTSLLANFTNAGIIDNTMMNNLETVGNAQISTAQTKFGSGSMSFDGTGDYMIGSAFSNPTRSFGTGNFTIEGWFYINANKVQIVYDLGTTGGSGTGFQVAFNSSGYPYFLLQNSTVITSSIAVSVGTWAHVAWVRNNSTCVIYVNGTSGVSTANSANLSDTGLTIGTPNDYRDGSSTYHYNGYIDDFRITNSIARYTSNFTPPTSAFPTY